MGDSFLSYQEIRKSIKIIKKQKINLTIFEVLTVIFIINAAKKNNDYNSPDDDQCRDQEQIFNE